MLRNLFFFDSAVKEKLSITLTQQVEEWKQIVSFISYEYTSKHLSLNSPIPQHCCTHALNKECRKFDNMENKQTCQHCIEISSYFPRVTATIDNIILNHKNNESNNIIQHELGSMVKATNNFQCTLKKYMAHKLRAFAQFSAISNEYKKFSKKYVGLWMDHKQKILPMTHREGQVEYFGKRGMSLLGFMLIRRINKKVKKKKDNKMSASNETYTDGLEYTFYDVIVENYSAQDNTQVMAVIEALLPFLKKKYPEIEEVVLGSDNASCFASHDAIPFINCLNKEYNEANMNLSVRKWIYTEACTGKGRIDTHFAFVNLALMRYVLDGNNITTEDEIYKALSSNDGLACSTTILLDGSNLEGPVLKNNKSFKATHTGVRETHEIQWPNKSTEFDLPRVFTISNITNHEQITKRKIGNYKRKYLMLR